MGDMRAIAVVLLALAAGMLSGVFAGPVAAQAKPQVQVTSVSTGNWPSVEATVTVLDAAGRPVTGLAPGAFSGDIGGAPLELRDVTTASAPGIGIAVVLTFDVSGSMAGAPLDQSKAAARALVAQLGPDDQVAVVAFATGVTVVQGFTKDRAAANAAIAGLVAEGNTALYAGVRDSIKLAASAPLPRRAVVLLSDGVDFGGVSGVDPASTLAQAEASGAIIFTIGLGAELDRAYLGDLAARGKGQFKVAPAPADLTDLYEYAASVLRSQYILAFDASGIDAAAAAGKPLTVRVDVGGVAVAGAAAIDVPQPPTLSPTPAPTAAPTAVPGATGESSGGLSPVVIAGAAVAAVLPASLVLTLLFRKRTASRRTAREAETLRRFRRPDAGPVSAGIERVVAEETARAWLRLPGGEKAPLGTAPVTIGFTADCTVQLPNGSRGPGLERARIWWRDGSFMLHNLSRAGNLQIGGKPVTWAVLEDGDEIEIGKTRVVFEATDRDPPGS